MRRPPALQLMLDLSVILILLGLIPAMAWAIRTSPRIPTDSSYVVAGVTVIATLLTNFVTSRVQHGLIRRLEAPLLDTANTEDIPESLDVKWRGVLRIDSVLERFINWPISLVYLLCALLTTAIVTTFTPANGIQVIDYHPLIPGGAYPLAVDGQSEACAGIAVGKFVPASYGWQMDNGSMFFAKYEGDCPASRVVGHASNINNENVDDYAYVDSGVAVHRTAMGASAHLFRGTAFQRLTEENGRKLRSTTQCVPVMTKNPVSCQIGGGVLTRIEDKKLKLVMDVDGRRERIVEFISRNLTQSSAMVNYLWVARDVGTALIVYSAYNDPEGNTPFTRDLARTISDPEFETRTGGSETLVVACTLNASASFEYRLVTLSLQAAGETKHTNLAYNRVLQGNEPCIPEKESVSNLHYVAAATAQYSMVMENYGKDGYFTTINRVVGENVNRVFAFNESSRNAIEDVLGVIAAQGVSTMDLLDDAVEARPLDGKATARIDIKQFGSGNQWALFLIVSPIIPLVLLVWICCSSFRSSHQPGGGRRAGLDGKRPELYAAESMRVLRNLSKRPTLD